MGHTRLLLLSAIMLSRLLIPIQAHGGEVTITAVGDIMLSGSYTPFLNRHGYSFPFDGTRNILQGSGITVGNLELPITERGSEFTGKRFRFRSPPEAAQALRNAGFSVLTLANNHILDYGAEGVKDTLVHLNRAGIGHVGAGKNLDVARTPAIMEVAGRKTAFLAYSLTYPEEFFAGRRRHGTAPGYDAFIADDIRLAKRKADHVIVSFHWGRELEEKPRPYQERAARRAIDAGADIVLGHHPHVLQGIERYKDGIIFYSLGNFAFGSSSRHADRSIIARIILDGGIRSVEIIPLNVLNREVRYQPQVLTGNKGAALIERLNGLSKGRGVTIIQSGETFRLAGFDANKKVAVQ